MSAIAGVWHLATIATKFRVLAPSGGSGKREAISTGDETMKIGMDIGAERQCPCPLWGQDLAKG